MIPQCLGKLHLKSTLILWRDVSGNMEYPIPPTWPSPFSLRCNIFSEKFGYVLSVSCPSENKLQTSVVFHSPRICQEAVSTETQCLNMSPQELVFSRQSEGRMKTEKLELVNKFVSKDKSCIYYFLLWGNPKYLGVCILCWVSGQMTQQAWELFIVFLSFFGNLSLVVIM